MLNLATPNTHRCSTRKCSIPLRSIRPIGAKRGYTTKDTIESKSRFWTRFHNRTQTAGEQQALLYSICWEFGGIFFSTQSLLGYTVMFYFTKMRGVLIPVWRPYLSLVAWCWWWEHAAELSGATLQQSLVSTIGKYPQKPAQSLSFAKSWESRDDVHNFHPHCSQMWVEIIIFFKLHKFY